MNVDYVDLVDYVAIAAEITGLDTATLMRTARLDLADSALHAPASGFGDVGFFPDFVMKAAVLVVRLTQNHPSLTATSGPHGSHCACSWRSTVGHGRLRRRSTTQSSRCLRCLRSPPAIGTTSRWQPGWATASPHHEPAPLRCPSIEGTRS